MNLIKKLIRIFIQPDVKEYVEISRNERCFCNSGKKYKNCHLMLLEKKGKIALYELDNKTNTKKIKMYSKRKFKGISSKSPTTLRGVDVKATNIALNDYNPEVHDIYKF
jgi:hypothetical protein